MSAPQIRIGIRVLATLLALALVVSVLYVAQATGSVATPTKSFKRGTSTSHSVSDDDDDDDNGKRRKKCKRRYKKHGKPSKCRKHDRHNDDDDDDD